MWLNVLPYNKINPTFILQSASLTRWWMKRFHFNLDINLNNEQYIKFRTTLN